MKGEQGIHKELVFAKFSLPFCSEITPEETVVRIDCSRFSW